MFNSIRRQLTFVTCGLILLAMVSTLLISYSLISEYYENKMRQNNAVMAESLAANITQFVQNAYTISQLIAEYPDLMQMESAKRWDLLVRTAERYPFFQLLATTDLNGYQTAKSSGILVNRAERWWFKKFIKERNPYITHTYYSLTTESPITTIVQGIYTKDQLTGVLMSDIDIQMIQKMVAAYHPGTESYAYLLDGKGVVIAHPDKRQIAEMYNYKTQKKKVLWRDVDGNVLLDEKDNEITETVDFEMSPSLREHVSRVMAGEMGSGDYIDLNGEEYICAYRTILLPGASAPWSLMVVQKKSAAMAFMEYAIWRTTLVGILVLSIAALLTIWFSRRITQPLLQLVHAANQIKEGDFSVQLSATAANELGILADNFNQMVDELKLHREHLEGLVTARTAELDAANQEMLAMNEELTSMNDNLLYTNQCLQTENEARRQVEARLLARDRQCKAITGLLARPVREDETDDILKTIIENAVQLMDAAAGYIGLFDAAGKTFHIHHGIGIDPSDIQKPYPATKGIHGQVYATGEPICVEDYRKYAHHTNDPHLGSATSSMIMVPLKQAEAVKGILAVRWNDGVRFISQEDLAGLRQFGDLASVALERDMIQKRIRHIAFHDTVTGMPNRAALSRYLEAEMAKTRAGETLGMILLINIDDIKSVNDNFSHSFGDMVIVAVGQKLVAAVGAEAFVARNGGDEFMAVIPGITSREQAAAIADKAMDMICTEYGITVETIHISASMGVALYPADSDMAEDILKKADSALHAAKKAGKSCWRFYEPALLQEAYEKMTLTNGLRHGVERGEFMLYYQPQFSAIGGHLVGFEALLRWNSSEYGFVPPARFVPLAEQSGLILPIGQWVLQEACRFIRRLADMGQDDLRVAINISPRQLLSEDFVASVQTGIEAAGIQPHQIEIEVTESMLIESMEETARKLQQLQAIGVRLSLDDFGTGYSSLTYLINLPVEIVKIDKSFIDNINETSQLQVVGSIINLGHALGMSIVAEGVETEEQLSILRELGCDYIQGYVYSKPVPEAGAIELLSGGTGGR